MKAIYLFYQIAVIAGVAALFAIGVKQIGHSETSLQIVKEYKIAGMTRHTWNKNEINLGWLNTQFELLLRPKAYDYEKQVKLPILGNPQNGFYRDPFVIADGNVDYFCSSVAGRDDARLLEWLTNIETDLKNLNIDGVLEERGAAFISNKDFSAWVSKTQPLAIPIPQEFWRIVVDRAPDQIRRGKLLLTLVRIDDKALWFKIPLLREPLRVARTKPDNSAIKNILKPL